jgi:Response regulator receiver domain
MLGALEVASFEAMGAGDAAEAPEILGEHRIDVGVADYYLPGITGLDLLAAIKGSAPGTPLILYSGEMTVWRRRPRTSGCGRCWNRKLCAFTPTPRRRVERGKRGV